MDSYCSLAMYVSLPHFYDALCRDDPTLLTTSVLYTVYGSTVGPLSIAT